MLARSLILAHLGGLLVVMSAGAGCSSPDTCDGCRIDGACVESGARNPENPCELCDPDLAAEAYSLRDCSDGILCNGEETCDATSGECLGGEVTCAEGEFCDPEIDECVVSCHHCSIHRTCYWENQRNPENPCQVCHSAEDPYAWTDNDGAVCDDGVFCNGVDTCAAGACSQHAGDPCGDDGVQCNGTESCDEAAGLCVHSDDVCGEGESCDDQADQCCALRDHLECDANGDVVWVDSCGNPGELAQDCPAAPMGGCAAGQCTCGAGWTGAQCDQCIVHVSPTGDDGNDGGAWSRALATIPAAIAAADATGCAVIWVAAGTYSTSTTDDPAAVFAPRPGQRLYGGFAGTETSLAERDPSAHPTVLDGELGDPSQFFDNACRVMEADGDARIDGFTISGANGQIGCTDGYNGIGLAVFGGVVTVANCVFAGNGYGYGALYVDGTARVRVLDTVFTGNDGQSGGIYATSEARVDVRDSVFRENEASQSTAISARNQAVLTATRCRFEDNVDPAAGSVVRIDDFADGTLTSCTFTGNASFVGGVNAGGSSTRLVNCLFAENEGDHAGAILASGLGPVVIQSCTLVGNTGDETGGIYVSSSLTVVRDSVIWGNTSNASTTSESQIWHGSSTLPMVRYCAVEGDLLPGDGNQNADPLFVNDDSSAGPLDLHLGAGSPCIDAGSTALLLPDEVDLDDDGNLQEPTPLDLDGLPRVAGAAVDMGAYEAP